MFKKLSFWMGLASVVVIGGVLSLSGSWAQIGNAPADIPGIMPADMPAKIDSAPSSAPENVGAKPEDIGPSVIPNTDIVYPSEAPMEETKEEAAKAAPEKRPDLTALTKENVLKAYNEFMKMNNPDRGGSVQASGQTEQARDNPIWKFHSWLQDQLALMEKTGGQGSFGKGGIEDLCFVCHNGKLIINKNFSSDQTSLKSVFDFESVHPVRDAKKSHFYDPLNPDDPSKSDPIWERKLQCITCHNPAVVTGKTSDGGFPLTLPSDPDIPWTQKLIDGWPTLDNPPWPHDTAPRPMVYARPFLDDPNPEVTGDEIVGPDATEMPNFTTFCQTCHRQISGRYGVSNNYSRLKYDPIRYIKGDGGGNISTHGMARGRESGNKHLRLKEPFASRREDESGNVINNLYLSCTDCHEPHGSPNAFLIRTKVNGQDGVKADYEGKFFYLCSKCHYIANPWPGGYPHGVPGDMAERSCIQCHNHTAGGGRF